MIKNALKYNTVINYLTLQFCEAKLILRARQKGAPEGSLHYIYCPRGLFNNFHGLFFISSLNSSRFLYNLSSVRSFPIVPSPFFNLSTITVNDSVRPAMFS